MVHHEQATMTQTKLNPKLYVATGNAFAPEKFGADGIAAFVKLGFSGTNADYNMTYKKESHPDVKVYEYIYQNQEHPRPEGREIEKIVADALDDLSGKGCKIILMPPIRTSDCSNVENDMLIVDACRVWLEKNASSNVEKVIIADIVGQMEKEEFDFSDYETIMATKVEDIVHRFAGNVIRYLNWKLENKNEIGLNEKEKKNLKDKFISKLQLKDSREDAAIKKAIEDFDYECIVNGK